MRNVPLKDLKVNLAHWIALTMKGEQLTITKHNKAVAYITPAEDPSLHVGEWVGRSEIQPVFKGPLGKSWLKFLTEDRSHD